MALTFGIRYGCLGGCHRERITAQSVNRKTGDGLLYARASPAALHVNAATGRHPFRPRDEVPIASATSSSSARPWRCCILSPASSHCDNWQLARDPGVLQAVARETG
jgi:hypothetical protein